MITVFLTIIQQIVSDLLTPDQARMSNVMYLDWNLAAQEYTQPPCSVSATCCTLWACVKTLERGVLYLPTPANITAFIAQLV